MAEVIGWKVFANLNYGMQALVIFSYKIILNKLNIHQKTLFMKFKKDL